MIIEIRPVRCFTSDGGRRGSKPDRQNEIGSSISLGETYGYFTDSMVGLT